MRQRHANDGRYWLRVGIVLGVVMVVRDALVSQPLQLWSGQRSIVPVVYLSVSLVLFFVCGVLAAQTTRTVKAGVREGFLLGLVGAGGGSLIVSLLWVVTPMYFSVGQPVGIVAHWTIWAIVLFAVGGASMGFLGSACARVMERLRAR